MSRDSVEFRVIDFPMLRKEVFFPLAGLGTFAVQTMLYPLVLLRTRLQVQEGAIVYHGLIDAMGSVIREEGIRGLYRGYLVKSLQVVSSMCFTSTYESVRHGSAVLFPSFSPAQRSFVGGAAASAASQTILVPIDVISQHLMLLSRALKSPRTPAVSSHVAQVRSLTPIKLSSSEMESGWSRFRAVTRFIWHNHGFRGFYQGYLISLSTVVPMSALWWYFYDVLCSWIASVQLPAPVSRLIHSSAGSCSSPSCSSTSASSSNNQHQLPRLGIQLCAAPLTGTIVSLMINPLDCLRVRMQVRNQSLQVSLHQLWQTEGVRWFTKGLSARLLQTSIFSFWLVLIYEPLKVFCLKDEYRDHF